MGNLIFKDKDVEQAVFDLIAKCATDLPKDVEDAMVRGWKSEVADSSADNVLNTMVTNLQKAREQQTPICQDTGAVVFFVDYPYSIRESALRNAIVSAVRKATDVQFLRPNAVEPLTGKNSGDNTGKETPSIHFHQHDDDSELSIRCILKGGGSENVGAQYALPHAPTGAGRDIQGVKKVIIDAVNNAQGQGCSPGVLGICIGGDRSSSMTKAKEVLFRKIDTVNPDPVLQEAEEYLKEHLNQLDIGPMGFGGKTTVMDVLIDTLPRHPASFFVSMIYNCWTVRRYRMTIDSNGVSYD